MPWRPHGRASVNAGAPRAFALCDRCGFLYNQIQLRFQYDWRGNQIVNTNTLVCQTCYDTPYEGRRPLKLPADPTPIRNPRPVQNQNAAAAATPTEPGDQEWDEPGLLWDDGQTEWQE